MNAKIFSFVRLYDTSMVASVRIARFMAEELDLPIVTGEEIADEPLDVLVIMNGAYAFSKALEPLGKAIREAKKVVWVQNDYTIIPPKHESDAESPFRKAFVFRKEQGYELTRYWTTCEDWMKLTPGSSYVNWNCLTFDADAADEAKVKKRRKNATDDLFYYGSYRAASGKSSRVKYFDRYFTKPKVKITVSSPAKQFAERYPDVLTIGKMEGDNFYDDVGSHGAGLYIEDRMSHERFHSPANRFYEMLSAGLPMIFQPECGTMLRRAGYDPSPYAAGSALEVQRAMEKREKFGREQREQWGERAASERKQLSLTMKKLWKETTR